MLRMMRRYQTVLKGLTQLPGQMMESMGTWKKTPALKGKWFTQEMHTVQRWRNCFEKLCNGFLEEQILVQIPVNALGKAYLMLLPFCNQSCSKAILLPAYLTIFLS